MKFCAKDVERMLKGDEEDSKDTGAAGVWSKGKEDEIIFLGL